VDISELIRERRRSLGLRQVDLAALMGEGDNAIPSSRSRIEAWENGRSTPSRDALRKVAEVLDLSPLEVGEALLHDETEAA
jgi:transcriptional regulator with XRE-family HTH domain